MKQANFKAGMLDKVPTPVMAIDTEFNVIYMNQTGAAAVGRTPEQCIGAKCFDLFKTFQCNTPECAVGRCMREKKVCTNDTTAQLPSGNLPIRYSGTPLIDDTGKVIGGLEFVVDISEENRAVAEVGTLVEGARQGNLELRGNPDNYAIKGFKNVISGVNDTLDAFVRPIKEISSVLEKASEKDLCARVTGEYKGSFEEFKVNVNMTLQNLQDALKRVSEAVEQVNSASSQIAVGSQGLAEGASEQASSLEEISSSLEELSSMTRQNADNAKQAKELSGNARDSAFKGGESMKKMTEAIGRIKESSDQTAKILKTIDEIAFQTNLLALNAAVEAARAGEAGKGFAVVAEEVRSLAQRSAEAAKNTAQMIESAVKNAEGGVQISGEMSVVLKEIVDTVSKAGDLVSEISAAAVEQSQGIEQISTAVSQMDQVTQNNASNSEESAAAAEELNGQSNELKSMVDEFRLDDSGKQIRRENREVFQHQLKSYKSAVAGPALSKKAPGFSGNGREKTGGLSGNGKLPLSKVHSQAKDAGKERAGLKASRIIPLDDNDFKNF